MTIKASENEMPWYDRPNDACPWRYEGCCSECQLTGNVFDPLCCKHEYQRKKEQEEDTDYVPA